MINKTVEKQLRLQLERLPMEQQQQVLDFACQLVKSKLHGVPGKDLMRFAGTIDSEDLVSIEQTIHEGCERVNLNEW